MFCRLSPIHHLWWFTKMIYISSFIKYPHSQQLAQLRASCNLDGFWALESSVPSSHKYVVVVVEDPAATANTAQHRPFLWTPDFSFIPLVHIQHKRCYFLRVGFATSQVGHNPPIVVISLKKSLGFHFTERQFSRGLHYMEHQNQLAVSPPWSLLSPLALRDSSTYDCNDRLFSVSNNLVLPFV